MIGPVACSDLQASQALALAMMMFRKEEEAEPLITLGANIAGFHLLVLDCIDGGTV